MHNTNEIVILCLRLFVAINVANLAYSSEIVYRATATEDDVNSLSSIKPEEALPLLLFENYADGVLGFPVTLSQVEIENGRILSTETEFNSIPSTDQMFFCPNPDENEKCLIPTTFQKSEILQCGREPIPVINDNDHYNIGIIASDKKCGPEGKGVPLRFEYKICQSKAPHSYSYITDTAAIYGFCYDESSKKSFFAHHKIISSLLLSEPLLKQEREIEFGNLGTQPFGKLEVGFEKTLDAEKESFPRYAFQKFAPPEHWAFAAYRKATHHYVNVALQHKTLIPLWNEINEYIKINAEEMFASPRDIGTGVLTMPEEYIPANRAEEQKYNIWVSVITDLNVRPYRGLAILMNNFITEHTGDGSQSKEHYIDKLCDKEDFCVPSLKMKFTSAGAHIRCCAVTHRITAAVDPKKIVAFEKVLQIRGITYTK